MGVRNCADIGENLQLIMKRLLANQKLLKLLYYIEKDPYSQQDLTTAIINEKIFNKLIRIVPRVQAEEIVQSIITITVKQGKTNGENDEFKDMVLSIEIFVPYTQWFIKDTNLRPFAIMGEIQKSLQGKTVNGLGKLEGGDFELNIVTDEIAAYMVNYFITSYD